PPRMTRTVSPFRTGSARGSRPFAFAWTSSARWDEVRIRFTWRGAWAARFRWTRGCVLVILPASHDHARGRGDPGPPFSGLSGHGPFDVRPFHLALRGHDHAGVVLELDHHAFRTTEGTALPDDDRVHHLLAGLRGPLFHRDDQEVGDPRRRQAIPHAAVLLDLDDLHDLRAGVVDALEAGSLREAAHLPSRKTLDAATPCMWVPTKWTVFPRGGHSIATMRWPTCRPRQGGAWTFNRWVRFSYRSNFWMSRRYC